MAEITIESLDGGRFSAYLGEPVPAGPVPGLVVMQQIFGVTDEMKGFTDAFARDGYLAICPDLYWRLGDGIAIDPMSEGAHKKGVANAMKLDFDRCIDDLKSAIAWLRADARCTGKVGSVGYCLGGNLAFLLAARSDADCNVGYFGVGIERRIDEAANVRHPLMLHIPEKDHIVPPEAQAIVRQGLDGKAALHCYPDADHAFNRVGASTYDAEVTALADSRTAAFFRQHLS